MENTFWNFSNNEPNFNRSFKLVNSNFGIMFLTHSGCASAFSYNFLLFDFSITVADSNFPRCIPAVRNFGSLVEFKTRTGTFLSCTATKQRATGNAYFCTISSLGSNNTLSETSASAIARNTTSERGGNSTVSATVTEQQIGIST